MVKETTLYEPMSADEIARISRRRWRRHQIANLAPGISLVQEGRAGSLYFRLGTDVMELEAELAGPSDIDITINREGFAVLIDTRTLQVKPAPADVARDAQAALEAWLVQKRWRFAYFPV